jgi:nucleoside-diphosphate-sugar epimerase
MKILVTGGTGFVGRALIPRLIQSGHKIITTSRNVNAKITGATIYPITELGPNTDWHKALKGIEVVIHLAARVHIMSDSTPDLMSENRRINAEGTGKLAKDAAKAGVRYFIFMSTIKVNGEASNFGPFHAFDIPAPKDPYAIAKLEAEKALLKTVRVSDMCATIIRPPLVYGPGVKGNFISLLNICGKSWPLPVGRINNRRSVIYVGNLVDMVHRLIEISPPITGVYLCRDPQDVSTPELFRKISTALGTKPPIIPFPLSLLRLSASLSGKKATFCRLTESLYVDDRSTRDDLGWTPPFSMLKGLKETATWFDSLKH